MTIDFKNAAMRHYRDGELLYENSRWANADHLYGLSAECVLKRIIAGLDSASVDANGDFVRKSPNRKHFESNQSKDLWNYFSIRFAGRLAAHNPLLAVNPFINWDISQRYAHENDINQLDVDNHRLATEKLYKSLDDLLINGIVS